MRGEVTAGRDVVIDVNVILEGRVVIEDGVEIGAHCVIRNSTLRRGAVVKAHSHLDGAELGEGAELRAVRPSASGQRAGRRGCTSATSSS